MNIIVRGHNLDLTEALKRYATEKAEKISKFFTNIQDAIVELNYSHTSAKDKRQVAQITVWISGSVVRAEESSDDMYSSIDMAMDKIERQLKKYKGKLKEKDKKELNEAKSFLSQIIDMGEHKPYIAKIKKVSIKPMSIDEAILQMDLIHHDFFAFMNRDTNKMSVVYRRKDNNFGLLEPQS